MPRLKTPVSPTDHTRGAKHPQVSIVEYGDFQCPYCGLAEPIVQQLLDDFGSVISLTFRNFPLPDLHPMAYDAARAAEAAGRQGKYWEMHDLIFANQRELDNEFFARAVRELSLDEQQFFADAAGTATRSKIEKDFEDGAESGVNGTPTFFINGERLDGGAEDLNRLIRSHAS